MAHPAPSPSLKRFGPFEFDLQTRELRSQGQLINLRGQPLEILAVLLERPGQLVSRDELRATLWPSDTFVDFDHSLNAAVNKLREALGDSPENRQFIETIPRRGYRFTATVEGSTSSVAGNARPSAPRVWSSCKRCSGPDPKFL